MYSGYIRAHAEGPWIQLNILEGSGFSRSGVVAEMAVDNSHPTSAVQEILQEGIRRGSLNLCSAFSGSDIRTPQSSTNFGSSHLAPPTETAPLFRAECLAATTSSSLQRSQTGGFAITATLQSSCSLHSCVCVSGVLLSVCLQ